MFKVFSRQDDRVVNIPSASPDVIPFPTARIPLRLVEEKKQRSYEEIAKKLGFMPAELIRAQLLEFFEEKQIELYDYYKVGLWLTAKRKEVSAEAWCWRPLRVKDIIKEYQWGKNMETYRFEDGFYTSGNWACRPYERLVPESALEKVIQIEEKFGDRVKFFVSDFVSLNPDPFIMVRPTMSDSGTPAEYHLVFDAWDEPGFED